MNSVRVLIVDDELQSRSLIRKLLSIHFPGLITDEAENVASAAERVRQFNPQLIFLDVQMRGETGFDLLDKIETENRGIIFTTAHSEFAVKAFRYSAMDYLMKPIDVTEFRTAVDKATTRIRSQLDSREQIQFLQEVKSAKKLPDRLTIPTPEGFLFVVIGEIVYCHSIGNYTEFHFSEHRKILSSYTLGYYAELLQPHNFFRVHRSYLINLAHVKMYKKADGGVVLMSNGEEIEVSRSSKEEFLKVLKL